MKRITLVHIVAWLSLGALAPRAAAASDLTVTVGSKTLTPMKSPWADYFGTHYASSPEGAGIVWNTVRSYGGTHVGIYRSEDGAAPSRKGPFAEKEVRIQLSDFHAARGGKSVEQLIPELIKHRITAIHLMTNIVRPGVEPFDKDLAYWAVRQIHEKFPDAYHYVVWQMGNEVVSGHFDPLGLGNRPENKGQSPDGKFFGYNLKWKENFYVNEYLAPAIEATQRASQDIYGDPRKIQVLLGSMNPYNRQNIEFLANVMRRRFDGKEASTLKDEPVWKHIDILTVHYMTGSDHNIETLQQYHDEYLKTGKVKGIWITEDHGRAGQGPVTIIDRGMRFLSWAARNRLSAEQTRLCWWGEGEREPGGRGREAALLLGQCLAGRPLWFSHEKQTTANIYLLTDAADEKLSRGLVAIVPERAGVFDCGKLTLALPPATGGRSWSARSVAYSLERPPRTSAVGVSRQGDALTVAVNQRLSGAWLLLFADSPAGLPKPTPP